MILALHLIAIVAVILLLGYWRVSVVTLVIVLGLLLTDFLLTLRVSHLTLSFCLLCYALVAGFLLITPLRRNLLSRPIFAIFRRIMPPMSTTERIAIDAGDTWWERELMNGKPNFSHLLAFPKPSLTPEEQAFLDGPVNELCSMLDDWTITHELHDLPAPVWDFIKKNGFFGLIIPKEYGGKDFSAVAHSNIIARICAKCIAAGVTVSVPNSLGPAELLIKYGTQAQKDYYLPRLAKGEEIPCFALTSPWAGSDAGSIPDTGIVCKRNFEGKEVLGLRLNWDKRYITLAPVATVLGLAFKMHDPDKLLGDKTDYGITCALIPTNTPGITIGRRHNPVNVQFQNGPTQGKDVFIPLEMIIGGPAMAGEGWRMLMECLSAGRAISLPSTASGPTATLALATGAYARVRKQFGLPIGYFEGVEEAMARVGAFAYICEATRLMTAGAIDLGNKPAIAGAITKYQVTELARRASLDAMDIHGGKGICLGPKNYVAGSYEAMPIAITVEGANILTRSMIIFGQGALRCHPFVLKEMLACQNPNKKAGLKSFDRAFWGHAGYIFSNICGTIVLNLTRGRLAKIDAPAAIQPYYREIARLSAALALTTDLAMGTLGGELKRKEKLSARLGDVLSHLYLTSAILKRFHDEGEHVADLPLVHWCARFSLHQAEFHLHRFYKNFPYRTLAHLVHRLIFPFGTHIEAPDDKMGHKIARMLMQPNETRERLGAIRYDLQRADDKLAQLESALIASLQSESVDKKIHEAVRSDKIAQDNLHDPISEALRLGIINTDEAALARRTHELTGAVISVDDFPA
jgi:acyl-CoA dehydrogenase